jgi:hypothetical protein
MRQPPTRVRDYVVPYDLEVYSDYVFNERRQQ